MWPDYGCARRNVACATLCSDCAWRNLPRDPAGDLYTTNQRMVRGTGAAMSDELDHVCDEYDHCMLGDTEENRWMASLGGEQPPRRGHHCPMCADWQDGDTLVRFRREQ